MGGNNLREAVEVEDRHLVVASSSLRPWDHRSSSRNIRTQQREAVITRRDLVDLLGRLVGEGVGEGEAEVGIITSMGGSAMIAASRIMVIQEAIIISTRHPPPETTHSSTTSSTGPTPPTAPQIQHPNNRTIRSPTTKVEDHPIILSRNMVAQVNMSLNSRWVW